jgi:hypothetical protein
MNSLRFWLLPILILLGGSAATPGARATTVETATPQAATSFCRQPGIVVVTFAGYSGAGYEDAARMLAEAGAVLDRYDPKTTLINIGATADGIGAVYPLASKKGFRTMGIVSSQARNHGVSFSPAVERVFLIPDESWGGFIPGTDRLTPTSRTMVECSDVFVAIGGGDVARDELIAAKRLGKQVQFIPADMNHQKAIDAARRRNVAAPKDFRGSASDALAR